MVVETRQNFRFWEFLKQNTWFLKNNRVLPKLLYGIFHYLIGITNL